MSVDGAEIKDSAFRTLQCSGTGKMGDISQQPLTVKHQLMRQTTIRECVGLPYWCIGWESTCRRHGFDPWSRRNPHVLEELSLHSGAHEPQQLSPHAALPKPTLLEPVLCNKRSHYSETPVHGNLLATAREGPHKATKTQPCQK